MPQSNTQKCAKASAKRLVEELKPYGFKSRLPHLYRLTNDIYHIINFQCSQWGDRNKGRFTINLVVTTERLYSTWTGKMFPSNPGSAIWPISQRIGFLQSKHDVWFDVEESTDSECLAESISKKYSSSILEFFDRYGSLYSLITAMESAHEYGDVPGVFPAQLPLILAIIYSEIDQNEKACAKIAEAKKENEGSSFLQTVHTIEERIIDAQ